MKDVGSGGAASEYLATISAELHHLLESPHGCGLPAHDVALARRGVHTLCELHAALHKLMRAVEVRAITAARALVQRLHAASAAKECSCDLDEALSNAGEALASAVATTETLANPNLLASTVSDGSSAHSSAVTAAHFPPQVAVLMRRLSGAIGALHDAAAAPSHDAPWSASSATAAAPAPAVPLPLLLPLSPGTVPETDAAAANPDPLSAAQGQMRQIWELLEVCVARVNAVGWRVVQAAVLRAELSARASQMIELQQHHRQHQHDGENAFAGIGGGHAEANLDDCTRVVPALRIRSWSRGFECPSMPPDRPPPQPSSWRCHLSGPRSGHIIGVESDGGEHFCSMFNDRALRSGAMNMNQKRCNVRERERALKFSAAMSLKAARL